MIILVYDKKSILYDNIHWWFNTIPEKIITRAVYMRTYFTTDDEKVIYVLSIG